ncbi:MAG: hypothetical protein SP4CHLAM5_11130 [Chlamydiia bacterium]|nr:hypothetical protein [Chlamydiia bacterium]MCH9618969.1 hypothetical protein [Chlamydiia bacterium]MCH9624771.1 hypothetical protein [Chlamydiia bacterium]
MKIFALFLSSFFLLSATPPKNIPSELYNQFTENGAIPVLKWYWDDSYSPDTPKLWSEDVINSNIASILKGGLGHYPLTDPYVYEAFTKYRELIEGKRIAIIGSLEPWYECVVLAYNAHPVTIEYNTISCTDPRFEIYTVEEFEKNRQTFDIILSISSIEHDGLGRYGDPIDPYGDLKAMANMKSMLNPGGLLFLAVPTCGDSITFNAHRTYGHIRQPMLFKGWKVVDSFGFKPSDLNKNPKTHFGHQPVFVLKAAEG